MAGSPKRRREKKRGRVRGLKICLLTCLRPHPKNARRRQKLPVLRRSGTEPEHQTNSCRASPFRAAGSKGFGRCCTGHKGNQIIQRERSAPSFIDWMTASGGRRVPEETTMLENFYETCADNGLTT